MNKLKTILSSLLILVCSLNISGCKEGTTPPGNQDEKETTLTLNEAKNIINNSLMIDGPSTVSFAPSRSSLLANRNIFVKLKTVDFNFSGQNGLNIINGKLQKEESIWSKYSLVNSMDGVEYYSYYDGEYEYTKTGDVYLKEEFGSSYFGLVVQTLDIMYLDILFLDAAWDSIYNNSAIKTPVSNGYTITMDVDMARYVDYATYMCESAGLPLEGLFGDGTSKDMNKEDGSISLVVHFDKHLHITGLDLKITSYTFNGGIENAVLEDSLISVKKYNNIINEPDWFNINDYQ